MISVIQFPLFFKKKKLSVIFSILLFIFVKQKRNKKLDKLKKKIVRSDETQKIKTKGVRATAGQQPMSNKNQPTREPPKLDLSRPSFLLWTADSG